jgi:hypothetical protein
MSQSERYTTCNPGLTLIRKDGSAQAIRDVEGVVIRHDREHRQLLALICGHYLNGEPFSVERRELRRILDHATGADVSLNVPALDHESVREVTGE